MKTIMENINEILKESGMIMISRHDGLFKLENIKDQPQKKTFFQWFEKKFFGLLEECQNEYERFEKMKNMKYSYECPECGKINWFESEVTMIMCSGCDHTFSTHEEKKTYMSFNEFYGIQEKEDLEILDLNCLPDGWSKEGKYEFFCNVESGKWVKDFNKPTDIIIAIIENNAIYRYRLTPTKKTHEELAEEYIREDREFINTYPLTYIETVNLVKSKCVEAYIAGRKSMESDS